MDEQETALESGETVKEVVGTAGDPGGGAPLPPEIQGLFGRSLGSMLDDVRVHTGDSAVDASQALGAKAFTHGKDIHFNGGEYEPGSPAGRELLAHEVAHTVQQGMGTAAPQPKLEVSTPGDAHESEADAAVDAMLAGAPARVTAHAPSAARMVMREVMTDTTDPDSEVGQEYLKKQIADTPEENWSAESAAEQGPTEPKAGLSLGLHGIGYDDDDGLYDAGTMQAAVTAVEQSWNLAAPDIKGYVTGEHPEIWSSGENLNDDFGSVAMQQKVGPNGAMEVKDVFKGETAETKVTGDKLLDKVNHDDMKAATKEVHAQEHLLNEGVHNVKSATSAVTAATHALKGAQIDSLIHDEQKKASEQQGNVEKLKTEKDKWNAKVEQIEKIATGITNIVGGALEGEKGIKDIAEGVIEFGSGLAQMTIDYNFDQKIETAMQALESTMSRIDGLTDGRFRELVSEKVAALRAAKEKVAGKIEKLAALQITYDQAYTAYAQVAGKAVGGEEGKKITGTIEAVPKLQAVVSKLQTIVSMIEIPHYTAGSGRLFAMARKRKYFDVDGFIQHLKWLKFYKAQFQKVIPYWAARAKSAQGVAAAGMPQ